MTNEERAESAFRIVHRMNHWGQNDPETDLGDFISNLRHLCDEQGWDWSLILEKANYHYTAEVAEEAEEQRV